MSLMNITEIMDTIPHRYPFLLIDTIEEIKKIQRELDVYKKSF